MSNLRDRVRKLERKRAKDYDPEDDVQPQSDSDQDHDVHDDQAGRDHYEVVGKSRLRKPAQPQLDAKYKGAVVSRAALEEESDHDPFAPVDDSEDDDPFAKRDNDDDDDDDESNDEEEDESDQEDNGVEFPSDVDLDGEVDEDDEIDSDEALGESDAEKFKGFAFRGSRHNRIVAANDERDEEDDDDDEDDEDEDDESIGDGDVGGTTDDEMEDEDDDSGDEDEDEDEDDSDDASRSSPPSDISDEKSKPPTDRDALRKAAFSTASLASALSASATADADKGRAVKKQRRTFERILDARIKLQKGLTATSSLDDDSTASFSEDEVKAAAAQAEAAALALFNTITSLRAAFLPSGGGGAATKSAPKRKSSTPAALSYYTSTATTLEAAAVPARRAALNKWHAKTAPIDHARSAGLHRREAATTLTDVLDTYLSTEASKLVSASTTSGSTDYDDNAFYQSLLRDLLAARGGGGGGGGTSTSTDMPLLLPTTKLHASGNRARAQARDTKASKGRKVRYTVHEKLQNFMAAEGRGSWGELACREFFASLLGQRGALLEEEGLENGHGSAGEDEDEDGREAEALRLFRS